MASGPQVVKSESNVIVHKHLEGARKSSDRHVNLNRLTIYLVNKLTTLNEIVEPG
jgi:hypothetical protein